MGAGLIHLRGRTPEYISRLRTMLPPKYPRGFTTCAHLKGAIAIYDGPLDMLAHHDGAPLA
jgi:hypothetical protein